ncbi:NirD/YgiW/YdeI family stress tolerance protein [Proteus sp. GOKU]|uniref:YgiW/YdeI family stress tolerance OB fold protein n=1 Tax=Proteus TaxID=583 RepID=UPI001892C4CD|nr:MULTISPECIES: NirD/YgiW/YdeI family stress tolerance protein [Proteus]QPB79255.1 NirD/YgiW/YdeI family stress tolerance protein [Proteus sp. GOKU]QQP25262.1 NirD/YgiW/YdeI family stress tolerance protein [Proteus vulgaris]
MKKLLMVGVLSAAVLSLSFNAMANYNENHQANSGGFVSQSTSVTSISNVDNLPNNSTIIIEGFIVRNINHNVYEFKDDSGSIRVKIDNDKWNGLNVSSDTKIRIEGRVDNHLVQDEINVGRISLVGQ